MLPLRPFVGNNSGRFVPAQAKGHRLPGVWHSKPWGVVAPALFTGVQHPEPMGELRFSPSAALPDLLVKYLCAAQDLSVQIHPTDAQARELGLGACGKDECWIILHADAGARIGLGLRQSMTREEFSRAVQAGGVMDWIEHIPVKAGDVFYIPANTIHTIGAGITLLEVQQNCDITLRLFDFERERPLHLAECFAYARRVRHAMRHRRKHALAASGELARGPYFSVYAICDGDVAPLPTCLEGPVLVLPVTGHAAIGATAVFLGECALAHDWRDIEWGQPSACIVVIPPTA